MSAQFTQNLIRAPQIVGYAAFITNSSYAAFKVFSKVSNLMDIFLAGICSGVIDGYRQSSKRRDNILQQDNLDFMEQDLASNSSFSRIIQEVRSEYSEATQRFEQGLKNFDTNIRTEFMSKVKNQFNLRSTAGKYIDSPSRIFLAAPGTEGIATDLLLRHNLLNNDNDGLTNLVTDTGRTIQTHINAFITTSSTYIFRFGSYVGNACGNCVEYLAGCRQEEKSTLRQWTEFASLNVLKVGAIGLFIFRMLAKIGFSVVQAATCAVLGFHDGLFIGMDQEQSFQINSLENKEDLSEILRALTSDSKTAFDVAYDNAYADITKKNKQSMEELLKSNPLNTGKAADLQIRKIFRMIMGEKFFDDTIAVLEAYVNGGKAMVCDLSYRLALGIGWQVRNLFVGNDVGQEMRL